MTLTVVKGISPADLVMDFLFPNVHATDHFLIIMLYEFIKTTYNIAQYNQMSPVTEVWAAFRLQPDITLTTFPQTLA